MRVLLDTHALLWALSSPRKLPKRALAIVQSPENSVFVSAASTWEIAIKGALGKLHADVEEIAQEIREVGFSELTVNIQHTVRLKKLPTHHRDPFDRIIVSQAQEEGLTVISQDSAFSRYSVPVLWE
jgi:PIN domain nuclease of toxin-antitoxin system